METLSSTTVALPLDNDEEHPRRLLSLKDRLVACGGDDGSIALVEHTRNSSAAAQCSARPIRRFDDDCVRAMAVSDDGTRIVIGSDAGTILVYDYDKDPTADPSDEADHPFIRNSPHWNKESSHKNEDNDDDDMFMSQSDALQAVYAGEKTFAGPSFEAPIRDLHFLPHSHDLVIATETALTIVRVASSSGFAEHTHELAADGGVRSLSILVTEHGSCVLTALDMSGRLTHYRITRDSRDGTIQSCQTLRKETRLAVEKRDVGEMLGASPACRSVRPTWLRTRDRTAVLVVGGQTYLQMRVLDEKTMEIVEQDQPLSIMNDATGGIQGHLDSIVMVEPIGNDHLVSCGRDHRLVLWRLASRQDGSLQALFLQQLNQDCSSVPTHLVWQNNRLFAALADGKLCIVSGLSSIAFKNNSSATGTANKVATADRPGVDEPDDDDEDDDDDDGPPLKNRYVDDEAEDDDDDESTRGPTKRASIESPGRRHELADDDISEDDYSATDSYRQRPPPPPPQPTLRLPDPQPAFAPSSTPLGLSRRFMCWNHMGAVTHSQAVPGVSRSSIDIDFTDSLTRRPINFTDNIGFILGSLGEDGAIFATDLAEDDDEANENLDEVINGLHMSETTKTALRKSQRKRMRKDGTKSTGSTVFFHRFETFASIRDKDWYLTLPDGERALGCACGEGWAAVITSRRFLRLFSSGGNQGLVVWLPGEAVSMVGRGRYLAVFYHQAPPLMDETQKIGFTLMDAFTSRTLTKGSASCISAGSCLVWAGFTNEYSLMAMDSDGMLSMLASSGSDEGLERVGWDWVPVLDTVGLRKSIDDSFWPISVYDGKLICVPLKGGVKHPDASRRPVTSTIGLRLPLARGTLSSVNALEELSIRADIAFNQKKLVNMLCSADDESTEIDMRTISAQLDKVTLKMFATVVEAGKLERALDLVDRLHLEKSFDLAMKLADKHHKLVDLIEEAKDRRFGERYGMEEEEGEDAITDMRHSRLNESGRQRITPDASSNRRAKRAFEVI